MSEANDLYSKETIRLKVNEIWSRVFEKSNEVIRDAQNFGFLGMELIPDPNIHTMLGSLTLLTQVITFLISEAECRDDTDSVRKLLNTKAQLLRLERLANELKSNNEEGFNSVLDELNRQAVF